MTKQDFELIASVLADARPPQPAPGNIAEGCEYDCWEDVVKGFEDELADRFPRFDRVRFLQACAA